MIPRSLQRLRPQLSHTAGVLKVACPVIRHEVLIKGDMADCPPGLRDREEAGEVGSGILRSHDDLVLGLLGLCGVRR